MSIIRAGRRRYRLQLTYRRILFVLRALKDDALLDHDKLVLMLQLLVRGRIPTDISAQTALMDALCTHLRQNHTASAPRPLMSLIQDSALINAAFLQTYGIDLHAADLPWDSFCELLSGLPANTRFSEIVALRARPVPPPDRHNARYREALLKAKAAAALQLTEEEQQAAYQSGLDSLAHSLISWAEQTSPAGQTGTGITQPASAGEEGGEIHHE